MTQQERAIARHFAQAFFHVFSQKVMHEQELLRIYDLMRHFQKHPGCMSLLKVTIIPAQEKIRILTQLLCQQFGLGDHFAALIQLLVKKQRAYLLQVILEQLLDIMQEEGGLQIFKVYSSLSLSDDQKEIIKNFLKQHIAHAYIYQYRIDPSLIAGIRVQNYHLLLEHSIRGYLRSVVHTLGVSQ